MEVNFGEALFDAAQHPFMPVDLEVRMQAALHQHAGAAQLHRLANLFVNRVEIEDVTLFSFGSFERPVKRAEGAVLGAEICVIDVAVNDVADHALRVQFAAEFVRFHANANQVIGMEKVEGLGFAQRHRRPYDSSGLRPVAPSPRLCRCCVWGGRHLGDFVSPASVVANQRHYRAQNRQADQDG